MATPQQIRRRGRWSLIIGTVFAALTLGAVLAYASSGSPSVTSDFADYAPGSTVTLTGSGWQSGEAVHIFVNDNVGQTWSYNADVTTDDQGNFTNSFQLPDWFVAMYSATATGASSGVATTTFTDQVAFSLDSATFAWYQGGNFDLTVSGTYRCDTNSPTANNCTSASIALGVFHSDGTNNSVSGAAVATQTLAKGPAAAGTAWTHTFQFRTSPAAGQFAIPSDGKYDVKAAFTFSPGSAGSTANNKFNDDAFGVDSTPPTSAVTSVTQGNPLTASGTASDATSGLNAGNPKPLHVEIRIGSSGGSTVAGTGQEINVAGGGGWSYSTSTFPTTPGTYCVVSRATDVAGNVQSGVGSSCYAIAAPDTTAPSIGFTTSPSSPNGDNGWFKTSPVVVHMTATDADDNISNIACTVDSVGVTLTNTSGIGSSHTASGDISIATDGGHTVSCTATDSHSNTTNPAGTTGVKIDTVAPSVSGAPTTSPNGAGWYKTDVTIDWTCNDATSALAAGCPAGSTISSEGTGRTASSGNVYDNAGNFTNATSSPAVNIDKTKPTITFDHRSPLANVDGWSKTDVTVYWNCTDSLSGPVAAFVNETTSGEGSNLSVTGTCEDKAGNTADNQQSGIKVDKTAPTVNCNAASLVLNQPNAEVSAAVSDALSGPVNTTEYGNANTSSVGSKTVSITGSDNAGNQTTKACSYTVGYNFDGLYAPVDRPTTMNVSKAGQAIPLKWRLTDYFGSGVTTLTSVTVNVQGVNCSLSTTIDQLEEYAPGSSGLQNLGNGYYQFNWKTPTSYLNSCKSLSLNLGEADPRSNLALFTFKK
jgi:hypothetical protein